MSDVEVETSPVGIPTFAGTPGEVGEKLRHIDQGQVVALLLQDSSKVDAVGLGQILARVVQLLEMSITAQNEKTFNALVEILVPRTPPPPALLKEAAMTARPQKAVMEGADWLTAAQIAEIAGLSDKNPSAQPNKWKRNGEIFAISLNGNDYFPGYGLDREQGYRPLKPLKSIIERFRNTKNGWGLAYWFESLNSF